jgi:hypothetical protein
MAIKLTTVHDRHPEQFKSETPEQMVGMLWKTAFVKETGPDTYMTEVARRVKMYNSHDVRTDTAQNFLLDMEAAGLVNIEWD